MKKTTIMLFVFFSLISNSPVLAKTLNETDTDLCEAYKYALIQSLRKPVDQAIIEIYKDDKNAPDGLTWAAYDAEILKIKQLFGVGGAYEISLKVRPYYRAHITYGEDIVIVHSNGELIEYKHVKTYPKVEFQNE